MRGAFIKALIEIAKNDSRILLLTGDLGYMALEPFSETFPDRYINVGVAEQNMIGLATGLAKEGFIPFVYSIVPFSVLRPYEFIRNGPIQHKLPVRIIGVGGGVEYGNNGLSHYGLEDVGVLRIQPGITVIAPADHEQAYNAFMVTRNIPGPIYFRLGKDDKTVVPHLKGSFELDHIQLVKEGKDVLILSMGSIGVEAVQAAENLDKKGVSASVAVVATLNPPPLNDLVDLLIHYPLVITVEAHYVVGGLGSLIAEIIADHNLQCNFLRLGFKSTPEGITGSQQYLYDRYELCAEKIADKILKKLKA